MCDVLVGEAAVGTDNMLVPPMRRGCGASPPPIHCPKESMACKTGSLGRLAWGDPPQAIHAHRLQLRDLAMDDDAIAVRVRLIWRQGCRFRP